MGNIEKSREIINIIGGNDKPKMQIKNNSLINNFKIILRS